jgi:hypothetical protein
MPCFTCMEHGFILVPDSFLSKLCPRCDGKGFIEDIEWEEPFEEIKKKENILLKCIIEKIMGMTKHE